MVEHFAGRYALSVESLHRALALKPALFSPYLFLGMDELELGKPELAVRHLEHAQTLKPTDVQTKTALGRAYAAVQKPHLAATAYTSATKLDESSQTAWYGLGIASVAVIEQDGGLLAVQHADSPWAQALYADELLTQGRFPEATDTYRKIALVVMPGDRVILAETLRHLRSALEQNESAPVSAKDWDTLLGVIQPAPEKSVLPACIPVVSAAHMANAPQQNSSRNNPFVSGTQMACLYWQGRNSACADAAAASLQKSPDNPVALFWSVKSNERRAVEALTQFERLAPQSAATFDLIGDLYRRRMQPDSALPEYAKALAISPRDPAALLGRAAALLAIGRMEEAATAATDALTDVPMDPRLNMLLSEALIERHHFAEAVPHLQTALASMSAKGREDASSTNLDVRAHALLGRALAGQGGADERAIAELILGLPSDQDGSLSFQLSRLYRRAGKPAEAQAAEQQARMLQAKRREHATVAVEGMQTAP